MDAADLDLFAAATERLTTMADPELLTAELVDAGLAPELAADPALAGALLQAQGRIVGRSTLLDLLMAGPDHRPGLRVVLPMPGSRQPPGVRAGKTVAVRGIALSADGATHFLVHSGSGARVLLAAELSVVPVEAWDPELRPAIVSGAVDGGPAWGSLARDWETVAELAAVALGHELLGLGRRALEIAIAHQSDRYQFGRRLVVAQSVRHRLADVEVELVAAEAVLAASGNAGGEVRAHTAKAVAARAALAAAAAAQQLCGAMGFTTEYGLHRVVRRVRMLDALGGNAEELQLEIGSLLAAQGGLPAPIELAEALEEARRA
ncbi:hypothetical protein PSU4_53510 [Pseudonocardia sulfidoxydans NBRC 16205]|uniref:Acyl-CoA dehydrogenase/oxidase C-terminal domain-containing protein n=1 Tax=Pseudonocardia sulfidoxydans NBRC 16205 TaxID=1223511 RepID=A0A511DPX6_9PSEU|nr:acyl-CoA dehydrogenase family protein [Pseudonocardia sulfidoxydans]GEL26397.1 hypothetical protein PSU4_53510 [Pseudonocardia sulfidoxydans NBRC 16205]